MLKSYKYRLYPTNDQRKKIDHSIGVCRLVYNLGLEVKTRAYKDHGVKISSFDLCYQLVDLKKEFLWINEVDSQALQASVRKIDTSFKNFFRGNGYPKYKSKKNSVQSFQCPNNKRKVDWQNSTITIPKIENIPAKLSRKFDGKIKICTVSKTTTGKYYISILVEDGKVKPLKLPVNPKTTIGIDLGIKSFVVTNDGLSFEHNRKLKNSLNRLKCLSRRVSRKKKGSNNRKKAVKCLSILHERIKNQRSDYIHKTTSALVKGDNQTFVIEDLNVAGMLKNRKLSQAITDVSFGEFVRQMEYKCDWYGKSLIKIGMFEPTSKKCSACGSINNNLTLSDRTWSCSVCNAIHDRDFNAAVNIKNAGVGSSGEPVELPTLVGAKKQE